MFKQITAVILLVALSLQILNRTLVYIDYYNNVASYAKNCENKAIPQMHCNGKCQMVKKIREQEKKASQVPERKSISDEIISSRSFFASINFTFDRSNTVYHILSEAQLRDMPRSHFHPPGA